ncbi:MAG TPA: ATP-dependent DNA helicase RecG, partial [Thermoanaerobaculia bacterium]|nr:ATP-dependent DNA helicase RecG [Thermoanaerobaculia bacterium]
MTQSLETPLTAVRGIGPARARAFAAAGYTTVRDLLFHLPQRYEDRRAVTPIGELVAACEATVRGRLAGLRAVRLRRRGLALVRGTVDDGTGRLPVVWFNRPYLTSWADAQEDYLLHGPVRAGRSGALELVNPSCERAATALHGGRVAPVYPAVRGVGPAALRRLLPQVLAALDLPRGLPDPLPAELRDRHGLPPLAEALAHLHEPPEGVDLEALAGRRSPAHRRLIYGELLELQLELALLRERAVREPRRHAYTIDDRVRQAAREALPFRLTAAQKRVLREIVADLQSPYPMLRLLQGDVGSGKTIVAALALLIALASGYQGAFMAPTELLAEQHYAGLARLLGGRCRIGLLTGSHRGAGAASAAALRAELAAGTLDLAVGTHALVQEGIRFRRLGLCVIDEQHRFGVVQRQLLAAKGERPDVLVMTATPIPRSLALAAYGDLDQSVLDELPPGRTPIATEVVPAGRRRDVYRRLREELAAGGSAYVVFPQIEGEEEGGAASVAAMGERVRRFLADWPSAVLHGRIPPSERDEVMRAFARGDVRVLVATTVVEVGVDVPEATWMVIESAERFGLAQLHQLRGRVGRGPRPSRCVALHGALTEEARRRLEVFAGTTDGFAIAEADLALRGPGELLGTRQAGIPAFRVADLAADFAWLQTARDDARALLPRLGEP